ncbi:MAG: CBS domain-containing protein [Micavibrio sp.]
MKIADVLAQIPTRRQIDEDASIMDAIDVMNITRSTCLLVTDREGHGIGILSEHDIVKAFAAEGDNAKTSYICDYMTTKIIAVSNDDDVEDVIDMMTDKNIRHIPVINGENIAGFLSIMELLAARKRVA